MLAHTLMRPLILLVAAPALLLLATACGSPEEVLQAPGPRDRSPTTTALATTTSRPQCEDSPSDIELAPSHPQLAASYESLPAITTASALIVIGAVLDAKSKQETNIPYTVSTVSVDEAVKGAVTAGDTITVVETAGVLLAPGERWLLFLRPMDNAFSVVGVFQGKMRIEGDGKLHYPASSKDLDWPAFAVPALLHCRDVNDVVTEIRALSRLV